MTSRSCSSAPICSAPAGGRCAPSPPGIRSRTPSSPRPSGTHPPSAPPHRSARATPPPCSCRATACCAATAAWAASRGASTSSAACSPAKRPDAGRGTPGAVRPRPQNGRMTMMRAVVYDAVGATPRVTEAPVPEVPGDAALVRVEATGVCRSDWHAWRGHDPVALPHIPGHEFAGTVAADGAGVREWAPGARVTAPFVAGCGACAWCAQGDAQVCPDQTQPGFTHAGSFAEYVVVRSADLNLDALPHGVGAVDAAVLCCRFATTFRALSAHARLQPVDEVAVLVCGGVGLSAVMIATALGARVTSIDPFAAALERARGLGAASVVRSAEPED